MYTLDRENTIKKLLMEYNKVDVHTLCSVLGCSMATVRRDIDKLEKTGFLVKTYGGAILNNALSEESYLEDDPFIDYKVQIGIIASHLIENDDVVFLASGSTCLQIARSIKNKDRLTIVTNSFGIVSELSSTSSINILFIGGDFVKTKNDMICSGNISMQYLSHIYLKKAFLSVDAIDMNVGYMINNYSETNFLSSVSNQSEATYIVADYSKFGRKATVPFSSFSSIPNIITNIQLAENYKTSLFDQGVKLFTTISL